MDAGFQLSQAGMSRAWSNRFPDISEQTFWLCQAWFSPRKRVLGKGGKANSIAIPSSLLHCFIWDDQ
jgi:hypothetical protein